MPVLHYSLFEQAERVNTTPCRPVWEVTRLRLKAILTNNVLLTGTSSDITITVLLVAGTYTLDKGRTVYNTVSAPGWSTTLCGMTPELTGVTHNGWKAPWLGHPPDVGYITDFISINNN